MTRIRRALGLIAAAALLAAQAAAPGLAIARSGASAGACAPGDTGGSLARGGIADSRGVIREKDTGQVVEPMPASAVGAAPAGFVATVPVYFHVITSGLTGYLSDAQIANQIDVLNTGFGGGDGGANSGFSFTLAGVSRTDNAKWYASRGGAEAAMKKALKQGGDNALNVYSTSGGGYLGWAYLPSITNSAKAYLDGVVIDWRTVPGASTVYAGRYDQGETLTHEVGHWLNLEHTFYGGCTATGDFVADTPAQKTATSGCPVGKDTCPAPGEDPVHNYMDYSYDSCLTEFTPGQAQRMADAWLLYRAT